MARSSERASKSNQTTRRRTPRHVVRLWAWALGALSFLTPWGLLGLSPRPAQGAPASAPTSATAKPHRPVVIVVTKKIVYTKAATSSVSSSGPIHYTYAPAAAPAATTCGTHAC